MYYYGRGVTKDYVTAANWYRLAAEQGNAKAQGNLGYVYKNGEGVTQITKQQLNGIASQQNKGMLMHKTT